MRQSVVFKMPIYVSDRRLHCRVSAERPRAISVRAVGGESLPRSQAGVQRPLEPVRSGSIDR